MSLAVALIGGLLFGWGLLTVLVSPLFWFVGAFVGMTWRDRYDFAVSFACLPAGLLIIHLANG